jgi:hypothetical protein
MWLLNQTKTKVKANKLFFEFFQMIYPVFRKMAIPMKILAFIIRDCPVGCWPLPKKLHCNLPEQGVLPPFSGGCNHLKVARPLVLTVKNW